MSEIMADGSPLSSIVWVGVLLLVLLLAGHWVCRLGKNTLVLTSVLAVVYLAILIFVGVKTHSVLIVVENQKLAIRAGGYEAEVALVDVDVANIASVDLDKHPALRPRWRTNGIGLMGYSCGWYRLDGGQQAFGSIAEGLPAVVIPLRSKPSYFLVTDRDPERLIGQIKVAITEAETRKL